VCRSAPGSRSGSVTRSGGNDDGKERWRKRDNTRKKEERGRLPSLARTQAEGDVWDQEKNNQGRTRGNNGGSNNSRYLSGWGADGPSEAGSSASSEEEEDGELNLARILVPPKRQNSIKSLRKHLASEAAGLGHNNAHTSLIKNYAAGVGSTGRRAGREFGRRPGGGGDGSGAGGAGGGHLVPRILQRRKTTDDEDWDGESQEEWGGGWVRKGAAGNRESEDESFVGFGFYDEGGRTNLVGTSSRKNGGSGSTNRLGFRGLMGGSNGNGS
jgi:hypothetical protein